MNSAIVVWTLASFVIAGLEHFKPVGPERIGDLVKKLEEPTRAMTDQKDGPPDYPWPTFNYRWHVRELGELRRAGDAAVPALLALLEDKSKPGQARAQTMVLLIDRLTGAKIKPDPKTIAAINAALKEQDPALRYGVLVRITGRGLAANLEFWENLKRAAAEERLRNEPPIKHGAIELLSTWALPEERSFTPEVMDAFLPQVIAALADKHPEVAGQAASVIHSFGRPKNGVPELIEALKRKEQSVRWSAAVALGRVGKGDANVLKALIKGLDPNDPIGAYEAFIRAIGEFGPEAKAVVPQLIAAVKDNRKYDDLYSLHDAAVRALGNIGPDAKAAIPALLECLDKKYYVGDAKTEWYLGQRNEVLVALGKIDAAVANKAREGEKKKADAYKRWHEEMSKSTSPPAFPPLFPPPPSIP